MSLSQYNTRHLLVPPANGIDYRILNGYAYLTPVPAPEADIPARVEAFTQRAGFYFVNWNDLYDKWMIKIRDLVKEMESLKIAPLPDVEDFDTVVASGRGIGSGYDLLEAYHRLLDSALKLWNYHFEFLNLGLRGLPGLLRLLQGRLPEHPRPRDRQDGRRRRGRPVPPRRGAQAPGAHGPQLRRRRRVRRRQRPRHHDDAGVHRGRQVVDRARSRTPREPWFNFSSGSGFYHSDKIWIENIEIPFEFIRNYISKLDNGDDLARPMEAIRAERDRIVNEYTDLLTSDEDREAFQGKLGLARVVFPYVENHNFYVEHWSHSVLWRKMRQLGEIFV